MTQVSARLTGQISRRFPSLSDRPRPNKKARSNSLGSDQRQAKRWKRLHTYPAPASVPTEQSQNRARVDQRVSVHAQSRTNGLPRRLCPSATAPVERPETLRGSMLQLLLARCVVII